MTTNYDRRLVEPLKDAWLLDGTSKVVGVELACAGNQKTFFQSTATDGVETVPDPVGMFANQITVPAATPQLTVDANGQSILFGPWTVQSTAGVVVNGEVRVF